ncbi:YsnF/AvaK domain-containing protein [Arenibaculum pallidiluteum]|uniref:YsnF/AvaK domain-containing protein n=1 Tax=Arenibaculum pallidiluteum TaxID=2812559 RepID=UPI001A97B2D4|nr:YsnF/AvaK domain-containing protein [Arenibaculum pallidiluteum]
MTDRTIVALYDDHEDARRASDDLVAAGFSQTDIDIQGGALATAASGGTGAGFNAGSGWAGDFSGGARVASLTRLGVPQQDAEIYAEGVRRGGSLLIARVASADVDRALDVIERHGPVDLGSRAASYREAGWTGYEAGSADYGVDEAAGERARYASTLSDAAAGMRDVDAGRTGTTAGTTAGVGDEEVIPVVEEELHVGKRQIERGSVRVRAHVVETPVEDRVTLRDETVTVERRAVDRPAAEIPADAFRERTIEVTETDEEAVVAKEARVREEVVVRKDVATETQEIRDTVRHTEVEIEDSRTTADRTRRSDIDRTDV